MHNIGVIIKKQIKDTLKNKTVLIQFVMFPVLTLIFENAISIPDMPELFFTKLFSVMYMGMAPLVTPRILRHIPQMQTTASSLTPT